MAYEIVTIGDVAPSPPVTELVFRVVRDERRGLVAGLVLGVVVGALVFRKKK